MKSEIRRKHKTVFVGMSGGVDSSVAAALLKKEGYSVVGVHLKSYNVDGCGEQDAEDARRAAGVLGIPFYVFDVEKEYREKVVDYMVKGYKAGLTPNPDVMCNKEIKFGIFLKKALAMDADYVATGHYVRRVTRDTGQGTRSRSNMSHVTGHMSLFVARDSNKDQSYFLWTLTQEQLKHCLFPIGEYIKTDVRKMARNFGLPNAEKKDSQGICFLGQVTLADFLKDYIPAKPGLVVTATGQKIGEHEGAQFYTIGQRHGFTVRSKKYEVRSRKNGDTAPHYIAEKNVKANTLVVAEANDPALYRKKIELANVHFINPQHSNILKNVGMLVYARVRYRQPLAKARLVTSDKGPSSAKAMAGRQGTRAKNTMSHVPLNMSLVFDIPQQFVAPGQSAVFYKCHPSRSSESKSSDFEMLGGGIIL